MNITANSDVLNVNKIIDNDFAYPSMWAGSGNGTYIQFDIGEPRIVNRVDLAFYQGTSHSNTINISVSEDGEHFKILYGGHTVGDTVSYVPFHVEPAKARYIRVTGFGQRDTGAIYTSITEAKIFGTK